LIFDVYAPLSIAAVSVSLVGTSVFALSEAKARLFELAHRVRQQHERRHG
jgi:hypothetical protein